MRDKIIKGIIVGLVICVALMCIINLVWAGEKEELTWKGRALLAELELRQEQLTKANQAVLEFSKELEARGLTWNNQTKTVVEKPKPKPPEKKEELPKKGENK